MKAELMAANLCAKEVIWVRTLLSELGFPQQEPTVILEDNQSCIDVSAHNVFHSRAKHIDVRYHYLREKIEAGEIKLQFCPTADMIADIGTKAFPRQRFTELRSKVVMSLEAFRSLGPQAKEALCPDGSFSTHI
jgi:hypothetical protein